MGQQSNNNVSSLSALTGKLNQNLQDKIAAARAKMQSSTTKRVSTPTADGKPTSVSKADIEKQMQKLIADLDKQKSLLGTLEEEYNKLEPAYLENQRKREEKRSSTLNKMLLKSNNLEIRLQIMEDEVKRLRKQVAEDKKNGIEYEEMDDEIIQYLARQQEIDDNQRATYYGGMKSSGEFTGYIPRKQKVIDNKKSAIQKIENLIAEKKKSLKLSDEEFEKFMASPEAAKATQMISEEELSEAETEDKELKKEMASEKKSAEKEMAEAEAETTGKSHGKQGKK